MKPKTRRISSPPQRKISFDRDKSVLILIVSLIIIFTLLFLSLRLVGKALQGPYGDSIDLVLEGNVLKMKADINSVKLRGIYFELSPLTETMSLCPHLPVSTVDWSEYEHLSCNGNKIVFASATAFGDFKKGQFDVFNLDLGDSKPSYFRVLLDKVSFYGEDKDLFHKGSAIFEFGVLPAEEIPPTLPETPQEVLVETSSSSSGGGKCSPLWKCGDWGWCNSSLKQTRNCVDMRGCRKDKVEVQACLQCQESWVCTSWTTCQNKQQQRTCRDEHGCGTSMLKPIETIPCGSSSVLLPELKQPLPIRPLSFWENYKYYFLAMVVGLILVGAGGYFFWLYYQKKKKKYNMGELKDWMLKERQAGESDRDIRKILAEKTQWTKPEIDKVLTELNQRKLQ